jgi:hypothetical protein
MYKTCEREIDGVFNECAVFKELEGKEGHLEKRVHFGGCEEEEWNARRVLVGLREVHGLGRWGGKA